MSVTSRPLTAQSTTDPPRHRRIRIAPDWSHDAAEWILDHSESWRVIGGVMGLILLILGGALLFGGGYTSIQGVRLPLAMVLSPWDITIATTGLPALVWWLIPLVTNLIQIFARRIQGLRPLWWPSVIFDTATTAVFVGYGLLIAALRYQNIAAVALTHTVLWGSIGTLLGFFTTIAAEQFFLAGVLLLWVAVTGRH